MNRTLLPTVCAALTLLLCPPTAWGEDPYPIEWIRQFGGADDEYASGVALANDGGVYTSGGSGLEAFVARFEPTGAPLWTRELGGPGFDVSHGVAIDGEGNVVISGIAELGLGGVASGSVNAFIAKWTPTGDELWRREIDSSADDFAWSVAADHTGNSYLAGDTEGVLGRGSSGDSDIYVMKLLPDGAEAWTRQFGTSAYDVALCVASAPSGELFLAGATEGALEGTRAGGSDAFLTKLNGDGSRLWTRQIGSAGDDIAYGVAIDPGGNAFVTGRTDGDLAGGNAGGFDAFLAKYAPDGARLWTRQIGASGDDMSYSVAVDGRAPCSSPA